MLENENPPTAQGVENPANQPAKNNQADDFDFTKPLWQTEKGAERKESPQPATATPGDPNASVRAYLDRLGLAPGLAPESMQKAMEGDVSGLNDAFKSYGEKIYTRAIEDMHKLVEKKIATAIDESVKRSNSHMHADKIISQMNRDLPFTSNPNVAPVAQDILQRFLKSGKSPEEALAGVKRYFKETLRIAQETVPDYGSPPSGINGNQRRGKGSVDWDALMLGETEE